MEKIIKGRKYNTDTAKLIGVVGEQQKLYSKRTGEFFLYFVDEKIVPLSFDKAEKIVKEKLDKKTYNNLFNKNGIEKVTLLLDSKVVQDARNEAVARNIRLNISYCCLLGKDLILLIWQKNIRLLLPCTDQKFLLIISIAIFFC